ncbi:nucleolar GTP-binding protein 2 [Ixodes scapularis]
MTTLPQAVKAGYLHCRVRPYVPNPLRCFKCQRFGHGSRSCRGSDTCARCSSKEHLADHCENEPKCTNCEGKHAAYSRSCSLWKQEKEILTLKVQENIPYHEAKKRVLFASRGSYAEAVHRGPARPMVSTGTQTSSDDLRVPSGSPSTSGVVRQTPPPSTRKDVGVPTPSKEQGLATLAPRTALPPKGRGMAPRPSGTQTIPGLPTKPATSKGQPLATTTDEPMDQSGLKSDEDRSMSGSECSLPGTGGSTKTYLKPPNSNFLRSYQVYRKDRVTTSGAAGGVAIVVDSGTPAYEVPLDTPLEAVAELVQAVDALSQKYDATKDGDLVRDEEPKDRAREEVMAKGQSKRIWNELYKVIDSSDVVVQVLDARDPMGTRSKFIENFMRKEKPHKHLVFVLNKCDLVPTWVTQRWVAVLSADFPTMAFHASLNNPFGKGALINLLRQFSKLHTDKRQISVGFIGYPNVGKSSVINALRAKKVCNVAPIAGETKVWQYITLMRKIYLIDCPGVVYPTGDSDTEIVLKGVVRVENIKDPEDHIAEVLARVRPEYIAKTYKIESWDDATDFLEKLGRRSGKLLKGGEPDVPTVAKMVLNDWQRGKLPYFVKPPEEVWVAAPVQSIRETQVALLFTADELGKDGDAPAGHHPLIDWVPAHSGIPGNERAHRLARAKLLSARAGAPTFPTPPELTPGSFHDSHEARQEHASRWRHYLTTQANPLDFPSLSHLPLTRHETSLQQARSGALLAPSLLAKMYPQVHINPQCTHCHIPASLLHLLWDCPLHSTARVRALSTLSPPPSTLTEWLNPPSAPDPGRILAAFQAILRYLEDPQAPPLGSRLLKQYEPIIAAARRLSAPGNTRDT